ncbi:hypothetical protein [Bosea lathyri]|uniref:Uncharacterized protein n=1 Tax=Bosea lathyri TaxID=1036778 RepID=A0A1H6BEZ6_9HYPH|nr:hypothetical protein [Bosea lathyri]SEG59341.1 hypothetical protein SAMN04488115_107191 [Bosea lathyri]
MFSSVQFWSFVRQILLTLGGSLVTKGYIDGGTLEAVVGAIVTLATAGYGLWVRRKAGLVAAVDAMPDKTVISMPSADPIVSAR